MTHPVKYLLLIVSHLFLAFLIKRSDIVTAVHAYSCLALGLAFVLNGRREYAIRTVAYITGAEILWRMSSGAIFYEFGKYSIALILMVALLRQGSRGSGKILPFFYFALLVPSAFLVDDRSLISFGISGPLLLAVATAYFNGVRLRFDQLNRVMLTGILPVAGALYLSGSNMLTTEDLFFGPASNFITSGGIGPNQMSAILGLGLMFCFFTAMNVQKHNAFRLGLLLLALVFSVQCALTFSRGGLYTSIGAIAAGMYFLGRSKGRKMQRFLLVLTVVLVAVYLLWPALDDFTGGALGVRYKSESTTGRDVIALLDIEMFLDNPVLGVGPGASKSVRQLDYGKRASAHTEYTRLLAEHGALGLVSLCLLLFMAYNVWRKRTGIEGKGYSIAFLVWALLFMIHSAMRLAAPGLLFGLAGATFGDDEKPARSRVKR